MEDPSSDGKTFMIDLKEIRLVDVKFIHLAQEKNNRGILVNTVVELRVPWTVVNVLTGRRSFCLELVTF